MENLLRPPAVYRLRARRRLCRPHRSPRRALCIPASRKNKSQSLRSRRCCIRPPDWLALAAGDGRDPQNVSRHLRLWRGQIHRHPGERARSARPSMSLPGPRIWRRKNSARRSARRGWLYRSSCPISTLDPRRWSIAPAGQLVPLALRAAPKGRRGCVRGHPYEQHSKLSLSPALGGNGNWYQSPNLTLKREGAT